MPLALIAKGHAGLSHAVTVPHGGSKLRRACAVPHLGQCLVCGGVDSGINVRLGFHISLGNEQGHGVFRLTALLGGSGGGQVGIGEAYLTG